MKKTRVRLKQYEALALGLEVSNGDVYGNQKYYLNEEQKNELDKLRTLHNANFKEIKRTLNKDGKIISKIEKLVPDNLISIPENHEIKRVSTNVSTKQQWVITEPVKKVLEIEKEIDFDEDDTVPEVTAPPPNLEYEKMFKFAEARTRLCNIIDAWTTEINETDKRRKYRTIDVNVEDLRKAKKINQDETLITIRTIDSNIRREQPQYIRYLQTERGLVTFESRDVLGQDTQLLEAAYTSGMTYAGWEIAWYSFIDGAQTHGWSAMEVVFDPSKPLHVGHEYIPHDELYFPVDTINLQDSPILIRKYSLPKERLLDFVKNYGFDAAQVDLLIAPKESGAKTDEHIAVYKKYCKYEGKVYVAWFAKDGGVSDWLKQPEPLYLGIKTQEMTEEVNLQPSIDPISGQVIQLPVVSQVPIWVDAPIDMYPIFLNRYSVNEEPKIMSGKGRAFLDKPKQEALTAGWSALINGLTRSTNVYGSPRADDQSGAAPKQLDLVIEHGKFYNKPLDFWTMPAPDFTILPSLQALDVQNSVEVGQPNFAVTTKRGSRTTATEVESAERQKMELGTIQLSLFSFTVREIHLLSWKIVQSRTLQGEITLLGVGPEVIGQSYDIRAAGEHELMRQQKLQRMQTFWPVVGSTPIAMPFLLKMLQVAFPEDYAEYKAMFEQGMMNDKATIQALLGIIQASLTPEEISAMDPATQAQLQQILTTAQQNASAPGQPTTGPGGGTTAQAGPAQAPQAGGGGGTPPEMA